MTCITSTKYLGVYFVLLLSPPKRRIVRWQNFSCRRVPTMCRTCAGFHVFRGRRYKNNDIFLKLHACRPRLLLRCAQAMGRFVGLYLVGLHQLAGWLQLLLQQRAGRYSDVRGVSLSD